MMQGCCTWTPKRNIDLLGEAMIYLVTQILRPEVRSQSSSLSLSPICYSLRGGGRRAAIDRTSAQQHTQHSVCTHKNSEGSIKNVLCQRLQKLQVYFLNHDKKRVYEWWDTDKRPDLRILAWSFHFIYWSQNLLLFKTVGMSQHVINVTWERFHLLLFCFYEDFTTYMHMLILSVLYLPVTKVSTVEIFDSCWFSITQFVCVIRQHRGRVAQSV